MKFGTRVLVTRGGGAEAGTPGCRRTVRGVFVGARGNERFVKLSEDDPLDTVGWNTKGQVGRWSKSVVEQDEEMETYNDIGNLGVVPAGTGNPYKSRENLIGKERSEALRRFLKEEEPVPEYEFWITHPAGGARQVHTAKEANIDPDVIDYYWGEKGIRNVHR